LKPAASAGPLFQTFLLAAERSMVDWSVIRLLPRDVCFEEVEQISISFRRSIQVFRILTVPPLLLAA
jgi:hypothetical protein